MVGGRHTTRNCIKRFTALERLRTTAREEQSSIVLVLERGMDCDGELETTVSDRVMSR